MKKIIFIIFIILFSSCGNSEKQISIMERVKPMLSKIQMPELMLDVKILSESFPDSKPNDSLIPILRKQNLNQYGNDEELIYEFASINAPISHQIEIHEVYDNNPNTYFTTKNSGLDEYLIFRLHYITKKKTKRNDQYPFAMKIINGNAKDKDSFLSYNRIKKARFELYIVPTKTDYEKYTTTVIESEIKLIYCSEFELYDTTNWQRAMLNMPDDIYNYPIGRLIILDVYRGATNQTCISELRWIYF